MTKREQLIYWLRDAHAMETGVVTTLEKQIADAKGLPRVRAALTAHLRETKRHASEVEKALTSLGGTLPVMKEGIGKMANLAIGLVTSLPRDTVIKNAIAAYTTEHFEIACYTSLILTANALGEKEISASCKRILKEEKAMVATLAALFPELNHAYLATLETEAETTKKAAQKTLKRKSARARTSSRKTATT